MLQLAGTCAVHGACGSNCPVLPCNLCTKQRAGVQDADTAGVGVFHHSRRLSFLSVVWGWLLGWAVTASSWQQCLCAV